MTTVLLSFFFMLFMVAAMAIGVIMGRKPISGSCGGMAALGMDTECDICGGDPSKCDTDSAPTGEAQPNFYDASRVNTSD